MPSEWRDQVHHMSALENTIDWFFLWDVMCFFTNILMNWRILELIEVYRGLSHQQYGNIIDRC